MIKVVFFAQVREVLGSTGTELSTSDVQTVRDAIDLLKIQFTNWTQMINEESLLCAVNQTLVEQSHPLKDGDELAFFPPVTGG